MGVFRNFPYSNFHEMNLDEIIKIVREMQDEWNATKTEWASYKDFIDNYFENLDVSAEVLEALRTMAETGELNTIIDPTIANEVTEWLSARLTVPSDVVIDTSLSIAGACADAKATGDADIGLSDQIKNSTNINEATMGYTWEVGAFNNSTGEPIINNEYLRSTNAFNISGYNRIAITNNSAINARFSLMLFNIDGSFNQRISGNEIPVAPGATQTVRIDSYTGILKMHFRYHPKEPMSVDYANYFSVSARSAIYEKITDMDARSVQSSKVTIGADNYTDYSDADNLVINRIYSISNAITSNMVAHLPEYNMSGHLIYYGAFPNASNGVQLYHTTEAMYYRTYIAGTWSAWRAIPKNISALMAKAFQSSNIAINAENYTDYSDADNYAQNLMYSLSSAITSAMVAHLPTYGSGAFLIYMTPNTGSTNGVQLFFNLNNEFYYRIKGGNGWSDWLSSASSLESKPALNILNYFVHTCVDKPITLDSNTGIFIFGDSTTTTTHGGFTWGSVIASKFNCTEYNYGVGSAAFGYPSNNIISQINNVSDWSDCDVCFVAGGTNDANYNTTASALRTAVQDVITAIRTNAPNAKIIFITPLQRGQEQYNVKLPMIAGAICNVALENGCSVINGFDIPIPCYSNDWIDELTDNDGLHPASIGKQVYAQAVINAIM